MTSTVERRPAVPRKVPARKPPRRRTASVDWSATLRPGALAAAWALVAGLVAVALPVLLIWAADGRSGADSVEASRTAAQLWLLAHGTSLSLVGGTVGLVPLGLTTLLIALLHRAGRHSARLVPISALRQALALVFAIALPYALVATCLTAAVGTTAVTPDPVRALLGCTVVAVVGAALGVLREAGMLGSLGVGERTRRVLLCGAAATGLLLAAGFLLFALSLLTHAGRVAALSSATGPGLVGGTGLVLLQALLVPNAAVWGASWLAGPGFGVGVGTHVSPWATNLGQVPALPVLAGLPTDTPSAAVAVLSLLVPALAGAVAGRMLAARTQGTAGRAAAEGALVGLAAGVLMAVLALVAGGPLGGGRLSAVGPSAWQVGLAVAVQVGAWCAGTAALLRWRAPR
jgi:hypothetical protein